MALKLINDLDKPKKTKLNLVNDLDSPRPKLNLVNDLDDVKPPKTQEGISPRDIARTGLNLLAPTVASSILPTEQEKRFATQIGKGAASTVLEIPQIVGGLIQEAGERAEELPDLSVGSPELQTLVTPSGFKGRTVAKLARGAVARLTDIDKKIADFGKNMISSNKALIDEKFPNLKPGESFGDKFLFGIGSGAVSLGAAIGITAVTKNSTAASVLFGGIQKSRVYQLARNADFTPEQSGKLSDVAGLIEGGLESIGLGRLLSTKLIRGSKLMTNIVKAGTESLQEASQEVGGNLVEKLGGIDKAKDISENVGMAALIGGVLGGGASVALDMARDTGTVKEIQDSAGISEEEATKLVETIMEKQRVIAVDELKPSIEATQADTVVAGELTIPEDDAPLIEEAKNFETAEAFVENQRGKDLDSEIKHFGYTINYINKKPKRFYGKHFDKTKTVEIYTKGRTEEQIQDTLEHELGHVVDYQRRGIVSDAMGDSIRDFEGKLRAMSDSDIYFRFESMKKEAENVRKEFPKSHSLATTKKEIYADAFKIFKRSPDKLKEIAPTIYHELLSFYDEHGFKGAKTSQQLTNIFNRTRNVTKQVGETALIEEAKKFDTAEEFYLKVIGSATQYGEYLPKLRKYGIEPNSNLSELGVNPEETITIYRGIDDRTGKIKRQINDGDFVTIDFDSALTYTGDPKDVVSKEVKAKHLYSEDVEGFRGEPFYTGSEYVYTSEKARPLSKQQLTDIFNKAKNPPLQVDEAQIKTKEEIDLLPEEQQFEARTSAISAAQNALDNGDLVSDYMTDNQVRRTPDKFLSEELASMPKQFITSKTTANTIDQALDELRTRGFDFASERDLIEHLTSWKERKVELKSIIKENKGVTKRRRDLTLLKNKIKDIRRGIKRGEFRERKSVKAVQTELIGTLEDSDLEGNDKAKFIRAIKNIQTETQLDKAMPGIETRIENLEIAQRVRSFKSKIKKLLKRTKPRSVGGRPAGKFTAEVQTLLDVMRKEVNNTKEESEAKLNQNMVKYQNEIPPAEVALQNKMLSLGQQSPQELSEFLSEIQVMVDTGVAGALLKKFSREAQKEEDVASAVTVITGGKGVTGGVTVPVNEAGLLAKLKTLGKTLTSWDDILDMLSFNDKSSKPGDSWLNQFGDVFDNETAEKEGNRRQLETIRTMARKAYNFKTENQVVKKFQEDSKIEPIGVFQNTEGQSVTIEMTRAEARKRLMELRDPTLTESFIEGMKYSTEIMDAIDGFLTEKDKAFVDAQLAFYRNYYNRVNPVFSEMYGVNLPFNEFYSPIAREGLDIQGLQGTTALLEEVSHRVSITTGSMKSRVENVKRIKEQSDIFVLQKHIIDMEHFVAWADKIRELKSVFGDPRTKSAIKQFYGTGIQRVVDNFIQDFTRGGIDKVKLAGSIEKYRIKYVRSVLSIKPSIGVKQMVSFLAYADAIPVGDFTSGTIAYFAHPIRNAKLLLGTEYMKARGKSMTRDIQLAMQTDTYANFRANPSFLNSLMLNVQIGDQGAIVMGGYSVYRYHRKQGKSHEEALREFSKITNGTQQSGDLSQQSQVQRAGTFARMITMFKSSQNQYFRKDLGAVRNLFAKRGDRIQHLKTLAIFHIILPSMFQYVANGFRWDDKEQIRAAILGSFNGVFLVGDALDSLIRGAMGMKQWDVQIPLMGMVRDINSMTKLIGDDDITNEDMIKAMRGFMATAGVLTGVGLKQTFDIATGIKEIGDGLYENGLKKALGWSPYIVEQGSKKEKEGLSIF